MEGWGLLFEVRYHLGWPGGGRNGQNCPNFIRDDPVGSSRKEKILTKIGDKLDMLQSTFGLFLFFSNNSSSYVIFGHDKDQFFCFDYPFSPHTSRGDSKKRNKKQSKLRGPNLYYLFSDQFRKSENV